MKQISEKKGELYCLLQYFLPTQNNKTIDYEEDIFYDFAMEDSYHTLEKCVYCGRTSKKTLITTGLYNENICLECKQELLQKKVQLESTLEEIIYNIEYLFSIQWDKQIIIANFSNIRFAGLKKNKSHMLNFKKINHSMWRSGIEKDIFQMKIKNKYYIFKIRVNSPKGIVVAEIVYAIIREYLNLYMKKDNEKDNKREKKIEGIAIWYMIHYLYIMDYEQYADYYNEKIISTWTQEKKEIYIILKGQYQEKGKIMPLNWGIEQVFGEEIIPYMYNI